MPASNSLSLNNVAFLAAASSAPAFVGPLDALNLASYGITVERAYSQRRLLASYTGPADILRGDGSGSPESTIGYLSNGDYDLSSAEAARVAGGGTQAYRRTWYNQAPGGGFNASQATASRQPPFTTSLRSKGAIGGIASIDNYLSFTANIAQQFFIYAIVTIDADGVGANRTIVGGVSGTNHFRVGTIQTLHASFGSSLTDVGGSGTGKVSLAVRAFGNTSALYRNGVEVINGNAGSNSLPTSTRIGSNGAPFTSFFADAGNSISELIIFRGLNNPAQIPGWSAFDAATRAYYA